MADLGPLGSRTPSDPDLRRDARILLAHVLGVKPGLSDPAASLTAEEKDRFLALWRRRRAGEPVQYLIGEWDFFGRTFRVDPRALIPRPETEHLVEEALAETPSPERIVDLGCGSGVLAVTLALERPASRVLALDVSLDALALARENASLHGVRDRVSLAASDWLAAAGNARFDLVVANPPYVSVADRDTLPGAVRDFEPHQALFAGADGLSEIRTLLAEIPRVLSPGGAFVFEFGFGQDDPITREIASHVDWQLKRIVRDLAGIPRVAVLGLRNPPR